MAPVPPVRLRRRKHERVPQRMSWLFPEVSVSRLNVRDDSRFVLSRILERGRMEDVDWCLERYGRDGVRRFFRERASSEISEKTRNFWRIVLGAQGEPWPTVPSFRKHSSRFYPG